MIKKITLILIAIIFLGCTHAIYLTGAEHNPPEDIYIMTSYGPLRIEKYIFDNPFNYSAECDRPFEWDKSPNPKCDVMINTTFGRFVIPKGLFDDKNNYKNEKEFLELLGMYDI